MSKKDGSNHRARYTLEFKLEAVRRRGNFAEYPVQACSRAVCCYIPFGNLISNNYKNIFVLARFNVTSQTDSTVQGAGFCMH